MLPTDLASPELIAVVRIIEKAGGLKRRALLLQTSVQATTATIKDVVDFSAYLTGVKARFAEFVAVPGVQAMAQTIYGASRDITGDYTATLSAVNAFQGWLAANWPSDANIVLNADKTYSYRLLSAPENNAINTRLNTLIATIE